MKMNRTITKVSLLALASIVSFIVIGKYVITTEGLQDETGFISMQLHPLPLLSLW